MKYDESSYFIEATSEGGCRPPARSARISIQICEADIVAHPCTLDRYVLTVVAAPWRSYYSKYSIYMNIPLDWIGYCTNGAVIGNCAQWHCYPSTGIYRRWHSHWHGTLLGAGIHRRRWHLSALASARWHRSALALALASIGTVIGTVIGTLWHRHWHRPGIGTTGIGTGIGTGAAWHHGKLRGWHAGSQRAPPGTVSAGTVSACSARSPNSLSTAVSSA